MLLLSLENRLCLGDALLSCWFIVCLQTGLSCSRELRLLSGDPEYCRHDADPECLRVSLQPEVSGSESSFSPRHTVLLHILVRTRLETADDSCIKQSRLHLMSMEMFHKNG